MFPPCLSAIITYFTNTLLSASTVLLFFTLNSSLYGTKFEKRKYSFSSLLFAVLFRFNWSFGIIHIQLEELPIALLVVWVWIYFLSFYLLGKKSLFFSVILKRIFRDFSGGPGVKTLLSRAWVQVWSLVAGLKSPTLCSQETKT